MKAFLVMIILSSQGQIDRSYEMPDMKTCLSSVAQAVVKAPNGAENETTAMVFCSPVLEYWDVWTRHEWGKTTHEFRKTEREK